MLQFRKATNNDSRKVQDLIFPILREYNLKPDPAETDKDLTDFEEFYFKDKGYFEICEINNEIVGTWGLAPSSPNSCELRKMYLHPKHRGQGLGKIMLDRALAKAKKLGYKKVELETASVLKEAIALYVRYGFKPAQRTHLVPRCDQAYEMEL